MRRLEPSTREQFDAGPAAFIVKTAPTPMLLVRGRQVELANEPLEQRLGRPIPAGTALGPLFDLDEALEEVGPGEQREHAVHLDGDHRPWRLVLSRGDDDAYAVGTLVPEGPRDQLAEARSLHEATLASIVEGVVVVDAEGSIASFNERFQRMWGLSDEDLADRDPDQALEAAMALVEDPDAFLETVAWLYENLTREHHGLVHLTDGRILQWDSRPRRIAGEVVGRVSTFRDVTDERETEAALRESERAFRSLYENAPIGIYRTTPDGRILLANPALLEMLGYDDFSDLADRDLEDDFEPSYARQDFQRELEVHGSVMGLESTWTLRDGRRIHVRESARAIRDDHGQTLYYEGTVEDITARVEAEEDLVEQRDLYASLLRAQSDLGEGLLVAEAESLRILFSNDAAVELTGRSMRELGRLPSLIDLVPEDQQAEVLQRFRSAPDDDRRGSRFTVQLLTPDDQRRWTEGAATQVHTGDYDLLIILFRDVTERLQAEQALKNAHEQLAEAQRVARLGSWELDLETRVADWSIEMFRLWGLDPDQGSPDLDRILEAIHPQDRDAVRETIEQCMRDGRRYDLDNRVVLPDGTTRWVHAQGKIVRNEQGRPARLVGTAQDVTERRAAEEEVRRLNRELEDRVRERTRQLRLANRELEAFSYSVSHDLQAPLLTIEGFTHLLREEFGPQLPEPAHEHMDRVQGAVERMGERIQALLALSRLTRRTIERQPCSITRIAQTVLEALRSGEPDRRLEAAVEEDLTVEADPALVRALMENLLGNAWKFTRDEQVTRIHVGATTLEGRRAFYIQDNGRGIDPGNAERLFEPFQRLNTDVEGTGIGLATCQRIVARHGGLIEAEGEPGKGARFIFALA